MGIIDKIRQRGKINMNAAEMQHKELGAGYLELDVTTEIVNTDSFDLSAFNKTKPCFIKYTMTGNNGSHTFDGELTNDFTGQVVQSIHTGASFTTFSENPITFTDDISELIQGDATQCADWTTSIAWTKVLVYQY